MSLRRLLQVLGSIFLNPTVAAGIATGWFRHGPSRWAEKSTILATSFMEAAGTKTAAGDNHTLKGKPHKTQHFF